MRPIAILPIGPVNLRTGHNHMFNPLETWAGSTMLLVQDANGTLRGVSSCGSLESMQATYPVNTYVEFVHDQTRKRIGHASHKILSIHPITSQSFKMVQLAYGITALQMATFK
jgi:hypothetical protein